MSPRQRLSVLAVLALALWGLRDHLVASADDLLSPAVVRRAATTRGARDFDPSREVCTVPTELPRRGSFDVHAAHDPFNSALSDARPAARVVQATVVVAAAPPPPPPPPSPAPSLPYRFLGRVSETGGQSKVFLSLGTALVTAKEGDTLDGGYRLERITPNELVFMNLQRQQTVRLGVDGEPQ